MRLCEVGVAWVGAGAREAVGCDQTMVSTHGWMMGWVGCDQTMDARDGGLGRPGRARKARRAKTGGATVC